MKTELEENINHAVEIDKVNWPKLEEIYKYYPELELLLEKSDQSEIILKTLSAWHYSQMFFAQSYSYLKEIVDIANESAIKEEIDVLNELNDKKIDNFFNLYNELNWNSKQCLKSHTEVYNSILYTPRDIQKNSIIDKIIYREKNGQLRLTPDKFTIEITKEMLCPKSPECPNGFNIKETLEYKASKYAISTAGFRARQSKLFPWDSRERFNFFGEVITAISQVFVIVVNSNYSDKKAQVIHSKLLNFLKEKYPNTSLPIGLYRAVYSDKDLFAIESFQFLASYIHKAISSEVRFNSELYEDVYSRINANFGINVHMPIDGEKSSIWMLSHIIFTNDYNGGNYFTSSHARDDFQCSKDLSDEGAQFLPDVSLQFASVNREIVEFIEKNGKFEVEFDSKYSRNIHRDIDGTKDYFEMLKSSVVTESNKKYINDAIKKGWKGIVQDYVGACMYPIMNKLYSMSEYQDLIFPLNKEFSPFQNGIGKEYIVKGKAIISKSFKEIGKLSELFYDDQGVDASMPLIVERMGYSELLKDKEIGTIISNTDPDGDRLVCSEILENTVDTKSQLDEYGINCRILDDSKLHVYYSPNKMFLMTTAFYLDSLIDSGMVSSSDSILIIKTAQTSFAFNEYVRNASIIKNLNIYCIEPTVGFKEIAAVERKIEKQVMANEQRMANGESPLDVVVVDSVGNNINLGTGRIVLVSASEESGGQELAPSTGMRSKYLHRFAIGNREKSAGVASFITLPFGAYLFLNDLTIFDYWKNLIKQYNLTFIRDYRADIVLVDSGIVDPIEYSNAEKKGNELKTKNSIFWWNLARHYQDNYIDLNTVKEYLYTAFPTIEKKYIDELVDIKPVITDSDIPTDRAKDGVYLLFKNFYIAIRPSGTDPKNKGYYSGVYLPEIGKIISHAFAGFLPSDELLNPSWLAQNYYQADLLK